MAWLASAVVLLVSSLLSTGPVPGPPSRPGAWVRAGFVARSGAKHAFTHRWTLQSVKALAVVVDGPPGKRIRVVWDSHCELEDEDDSEDHHGSVAGLPPLTVYPPARPGSPLCYIWVTAASSQSTRLAGAAYKY